MKEMPTGTPIGTTTGQYADKTELIEKDNDMGGFNYGGKGDGTGWSSERGSDPEPGGGFTGNSGRESGGRNTGRRSVNWLVMNPGDKHTTKYGSVVINRQGHATMNGIVMTYDNSSLVDDGKGGATRVLNSLLATNPPTGTNFGNNKSTVDVQYSGNNPAAEYRMPINIYTAVLRGEIPKGFWLDNHKVMTQVVTKYRINGGGKGSDRTGYRKSHIVVPSLTNAYQQWKQVQDDIVAKEAKRKAEEEEAKRKHMEWKAERNLMELEAKRKQAEWDAKHPEEAAQRQLNEVQQRMEHVLQQKSFVEQRAVEHDAVANFLQNEVSLLRKEIQEFEKKHTKRTQDVRAMYRKRLAAAEKQIAANHARAAADRFRKDANAASQRLEQIRQEKIKAEAHLNAARQKVAQDKKAQEENDAVKDAIKFTMNFFQEVTEKFGERSAKVAKELANAANGKFIKNADEALKAFEKHKDVLNKKFSVADREAIANALESLNRDEMAKNLAKFSKAFGYTVMLTDVYDVVTELKKSIETNHWRPFFVKIESLAVGQFAGILTGFAFSIILGVPMGILGFALIITLVSTLVNDKLVEDINNLIGI
ncbi:colicin-like pore-forming protein [Yersinia ruckeri]|uniref:colicin-like pore-forming protein n=1 Tax=Yersinia ruckeri TaxID=29486 RepID=UPI0020BFB5A8|nr:colicin-like pore-forming protein [Yersinia ruckeri]MCK8585275.1 colicin-like pore-forming protein [Yersinia ruckeri]